MKTKTDKTTIKDDDNNYSFILKCLAATGAALLTAGAIAGIVMAATAKPAVAGLAVGGTTALAFSPIIPIVGIATLIIASLCVLPFLFSGSSTTYVASTAPRTSYWGGYTPFFTPVVSTGGFSHHHHHHHGHGGSVFGGGGVHHGHGDTHHHGHGGGGMGGHVHGHR